MARARETASLGCGAALLVLLAGCGASVPRVDEVVAGNASACASGRLDQFPVGRVAERRFFSAARMEEWEGRFVRSTPLPGSGFGDVERIELTSMEVGRNRRLPGPVFRADDGETRLLPQAEAQGATVRQVFMGELFVRWGPPFGAGGRPGRHSRALARLVTEHTGGDPGKAALLPCFTAGASPDLICSRLELTLLNPIPGTNGEMTITGTNAAPLAPCDLPAPQCARLFSSANATLSARFLERGQLRTPVVHQLPLVIAPPSGTLPARLEVPAVVDKGSFQIRSVRVFYRYSLASLGRIPTLNGLPFSRAADYDPAGGEAMLELPFPTITEEAGHAPAALALVTSWSVRYGYPGVDGVLETNTGHTWQFIEAARLVRPEDFLPNPCRARAATQ